MGTKLSVNINKIATLRNTRALGIPSLVHLGRMALEAGAAGLTIHPRPDQRHIRSGDVAEVAAVVREFPGRELNIEGNPFFEFMGHVRAVRPTQVTLVPDEPGAFTSDAGWKLTAENVERLRPMIAEMKGLGCRVSLFMDAEADAREMGRAKDVGADRVELYTEPFAAAFLKGGEGLENSLEVFVRAARRAKGAGLEVNAGHDLNLLNLGVFLERVRDGAEVEEVSIGHALIADAMEMGMAEAVRRYVAICGE